LPNSAGQSSATTDGDAFRRRNNPEAREQNGAAPLHIARQRPPSGVRNQRRTLRTPGRGQRNIASAPDVALVTMRAAIAAMP
jgi:hypothetical protein